MRPTSVRLIEMPLSAAANFGESRRLTMGLSYTLLPSTSAMVRICATSSRNCAG